MSSTGDNNSELPKRRLNRRDFLGGVGVGVAAAAATLQGAAVLKNTSDNNTAAKGSSAKPASGDSLLIKGGFLYSADKANTVIPESWVYIVGDKIAAMGSMNDPLPNADSVIDARGKMLLPGLVNAHWHESFVEGPERMKPDDSDLQRMPFAKGGNIEVLGQYFGVIANVGEKLTPEEAVAIARWSMWTQLRSGTTTLGDIGSLNSTDAMAQAALDLGMRIRVSRWGSDIMIANGASNFTRIASTDKQAKDWETMMERWNNHPSGLINAMPSILAGFGSSDEQLIAMRDIARQHNSPYAAHLAPLKNEAKALKAVFGLSSIGRFDKLGLLSDKLLAVHTAYATEEEYQRILKTRVNVCHSPANYGLLGEATVSETGMIGRLLKDGAVVSSSTDGNISYTGGMPEAMRATHLMHNEAHNDNTTCPPTTALRTGTLNGAIGLGWAETIGSLEVGKQADVVLVDIDDWRYRLITHPLAIFLIAGGSKDVDTVIVAGKVLIAGGQSATLDEQQLFNDYAQAVETARTRIFS